MNTEKDSMAVDILGRHFQIKCPADKVPQLQEAAALVDSTMRRIRDSGGIGGPDKIAVMAALHIAHEQLLLQHQHDQQIKKMGKRLEKLQQRVDQALSSNTQIEFADMDE